MKTRYIIIFLFAVFFSSCSDFLVENPTTQLTPDEIYNSAGTADAALTGCYATLATYDYYNYRFYYLTETASGVFATTRANVADVTLGSLEVATNDNHNEKVFNAIYKSIGSANEILYYLGLPDNKLTAATRNRIRGEASFIRALNYFNLVRMYGKASLITVPAQNYEETQVPRSSVVAIYNQIIADLDSAYNWLPANGSQAVGRPHRYAPMAMLAKVYLTMATTDSVPDNITMGSHSFAKTSCWDSAYVKAKTVIDSKAYTLVKSYANVFGAANKNSTESIFELQMSVLAGGNRLTEVLLPDGISLLPNATNSSQRGKTRPNKEAWDLFELKDPRRKATFVDSLFYKTNGASVKCYPVVTSGTASNATVGRDTEYPFLKKYVDPNFTTTSNCNFVVYRYADLMLVFAEAANEIGKTSEAVDQVNLLLERARDANGDGVPGVTETTPANWASTITQNDFRTKIMYQRLVELLGEGDDFFTTHRRKDFFRTIVNNHNTKLNNIKMPTGVTLTREAYLSGRYIYFYPATEDKISRNMLLPYPLTEINNNQAISQSDQNYGYN